MTNLEQAGELLVHLRECGFSIRAGDGKLWIKDSDRLSQEQAAAIRKHRDDMVRLLLDEQARHEAICAVAAPDFEESSVVLETYTLVKLNADGEPPEYLAVSREWLDSLKEFADSKKREVLRKQEKATRRKRKQGPQWKLASGVVVDETSGTSRER